MRAFAFAALFLIAGTAFCAADNTLDQLTAMANTKFGKTVLETIQVQLQTKEDPRSDIQKLLDELIKDTTKQINDNEEWFKRTEADEKARQEAAQATIASTTQIINEAESDKAEAEKKLEETKKSIEDTENLIDQLKKVLADRTAIRNRQHANWEVLDARYAKLISVLKDVERMIQNRINARSAKGSFIQKKANTEFVNALAELKETVASLEDGHSQLVSFLAAKAEKYLTPEEADAEAGSGLEAVVNICRKYQVKYENDRAEDAHIERERQYNFTTFKDGQLQKIAVEEDILASLNGIKADLENLIARLTNTINRATAERETAKENYARSVKYLKEATATYNKTSKQLTGELGLLNDIHEIVTTRLNNLRKNVEHAIINSSIKA